MTSHQDVAARLRDKSDHYLPDWARAAMDEAADLLESQAKALSEAGEITEELRAELAIAECLAVEANERLAEANTHITDLANELSAEIEVRYAGTLSWAIQKQKYELDMAPVEAARSFLNAAKEKT